VGEGRGSPLVPRERGDDRDSLAPRTGIPHDGVPRNDVLEPSRRRVAGPRHDTIGRARPVGDGELKAAGGAVSGLSLLRRGRPISAQRRLPRRAGLGSELTPGHVTG